MTAKSRAVWVFAFAATAAMAAETLLLAERQCRRLEGALREDFRVVLFLRGDVPESRRKVLEEQLRAQPEAEQVRYVPPEEALAALKREDPELVDAVALVGENPLPGAFEVEPTPQALPGLASWIDSVQGLAAWSDVRWKSAQLQAVLRAGLYDHWLRLALSTLSCAAAALVLWVLSVGLRGTARAGESVLAFAGALGGAGGLMLAALAAWPLHRDVLLWSWPPFWTQAALVASCAVLGWTLSLWRGES